MRVLQMLTEMVCPEELFRFFAFAESVNMIKVIFHEFVGMMVLKLFAAVATYAQAVACAVEDVPRTCKSGTRPALSTEVQRVLVTLTFILVF